MPGWNPPPQPRRARVVGVQRRTVPGSGAPVPVQGGPLNVAYEDSGHSGIPVIPPRLGSSQSGFQSVPLAGASVIVLTEGTGAGVPAASVTANDFLAPLTSHPTLTEGESDLLLPDGSFALYVPLTGPIVLFQNAAGTVKLTLDRATGVVNLTTPSGGGFQVNSVAITVP